MLLLLGWEQLVPEGGGDDNSRIGGSSSFFAAAQTYQAQIDIHAARTERTEEVMWAFENGMNGWCNATAEEVQSELWATGGELRGTVSGKSPRCDSPPFVITIADKEVDKHHFVVRMKHSSAQATKGVIWVRKWTPSALAHWDQDADILQGNATPPFTPARTDYSVTPWNEGDYYSVEFDLIRQPMVYVASHRLRTCVLLPLFLRASVRGGCVVGPLRLGCGRSDYASIFRPWG